MKKDKEHKRPKSPTDTPPIKEPPRDYGEYDKHKEYF